MSVVSVVRGEPKARLGDAREMRVVLLAVGEGESIISTGRRRGKTE